MTILPSGEVQILFFVVMLEFDKTEKSIIVYVQYIELNNEQKAAFYKQVILPEDVSLEIENFEEFYNRRKELLSTRMRALLT